MNVNEFYSAELEQHAETVTAMDDAVRAPFLGLVAACITAIRSDGKIVLFGNGGSAADAQHIAAELTGRYMQDRPAIAGLALTTDTSALTAIANDYGFDHLFARQVEALCRKGDVVIGISTSGNSANVNKGLEAARALGCTAAGLTGRDGGAMAGIADPVLIVPSDATPRIQEMHIVIGHMLCGALEIELGLLEAQR